MKKPKQQMNLMRLMDEFHSDERCRTYLEELRWPNGVQCPRCESPKVYYTQTRRQYECDLCGYHFSVTSGTMLHDTHLPLQKWLTAVYLMVEAKKGVSALQLKRTLNVAYKTAWYLCHRIRAAVEDASPLRLRGVVEVDETWIGGKKRGRGRGYTGNKTMIVGAVERDGKLVLKVAEGRDREALHRFINEYTAPDTEAIYTDDWPAYHGIGDHDTVHATVNHSAEEWVRGEVHTNTIEGVWSLFKRSVVGSYHQISVKHMDAYLDELEWRFNNRDNPWLFRDTLIRLLKAEHVEYEELTA